MAWTAPITYTVGMVLTAATLNAQVRDNELYLKGDSAWTAPTLVNSWVNYGAPEGNAGYKRVGDFVVLRGAVKGGTTGSVAFTLPVGYRPPNTVAVPNVTWGGGGLVLIDTAGTVTLTQLTGAATTEAVLDGVQFPTV